jgi:hypothetical protein
MLRDSDSQDDTHDSTSGWLFIAPCRRAQQATSNEQRPVPSQTDGASASDGGSALALFIAAYSLAPG